MLFSQIVYTYELHHTGSSTCDAFDVTVTAVTDAELEILSLSNGSLPVYSFDISGDRRTASWHLWVIRLSDETFTCNLTARILNTVLPSYLSVNSVVNATYDSNPRCTYGLCGRPYEVANTTSLSTPILDPTLSTDAPYSLRSIKSATGMDATIDELLTLVVNVSLPTLMTRAAVNISLDNSGRMAFREASVTFDSSINCMFGGNDINTPLITPFASQHSAVYDRVSIDFGTCTNSFEDNLLPTSIISIAVVARIEDVPANVNMALLNMTSVLFFSNNSLNTLDFVEASTFIRVVAPILVAESITVDAQLPTDAGDAVCALRNFRT